MEKITDCLKESFHDPDSKITLHKLRMRMKNPFQTSFGTLQNKELLS